MSRIAGQSIMPTIEKDNNVLTLINVFTVEPEKQQELVTLLIEATEHTMKHMQGFVSANIHRSLDGKKVVNYAQWESIAAFESMRKDQKAHSSYASCGSSRQVRIGFVRSFRCHQCWMKPLGARQAPSVAWGWS